MTARSENGPYPLTLLGDAAMADPAIDAAAMASQDLRDQTAAGGFRCARRASGCWHRF
jgi:hypothetical protein